MPHVYSIIANSAFPPEIVKMMGEVFDHAWASLEPQYEEQPDAEVDLARLALAKAVVMFAGLGDTEPEILKRKALRMMVPSGADPDWRAGTSASPSANAQS